MIITVSREFASGGRELGKRLADYLGIPCYDHQIIEAVAKDTDMTENFVAGLSEKFMHSFYPATIGRNFGASYYAVNQSVQVAVAEHEFIKKVAKSGDCVIVGRAADEVLRDEVLFSFFVCADDDSKIARCKQRGQDAEKLSDKEILRKCKDIDKDRCNYRSLYSAKKWGEASSYDLCINTSGKEIKELVPAIAEYIKVWYGTKQNG